MDRPTRWKRTMKDWPRPQWRDLIRGVLGVGVSLLILAVLGFPGETLVEVGVVGGSAIALLILPSAAQLWWAWFKAPMRLLTDDVRAIREKVESVAAPAEERGEPLPPTVRLWNQARLGRELLQISSSGMGERRRIREWVDGVVEDVGREIPEDLPGFLALPDVESKVAELEAIARRHTPYRTRVSFQ
jgi:hypothetical protein